MSGSVIAALAVMFAVTVALRAAPYVALRRVADTPFVRYLGAAMPAGVMAVLVLYTVRPGSDVAASPAAAILGIGVTVGLHLWRGRSALSVAGGTAAYMLAVALF